MRIGNFLSKLESERLRFDGDDFFFEDKKKTPNSEWKGVTGFKKGKISVVDGRGKTNKRDALISWPLAVSKNDGRFVVYHLITGAYIAPLSSLTKAKNVAKALYKLPLFKRGSFGDTSYFSALPEKTTDKILDVVRANEDIDGSGDIFSEDKVKPPYRAIFSQQGRRIKLSRQGKLLLGVQNKDDTVDLLTWKQWKASKLPNVTTGEIEAQFVSLLAKKLRQMSDIMDFNAAIKSGELDTFEKKVDWLSKFGINYTKRGLKS